MTSTKRRRPRDPRTSLPRVALLALLSAVRSQETTTTTTTGTGKVDHGNHNLEWEDGPASWEEFGHDNHPDACGLPVLTVDEWEAGRYWEGSKPVLVRNVTDGWAALNNWKKREMVRRYADAEATMGDGRRVGEVGPDGAGNILSPTTVQEFVTEHMYDPSKYFFDRKISIPRGMLDDCHPLPLPTRAYLADPSYGNIRAPSKKASVHPRPDHERWRSHIAVSIGADLRGLSFHSHGEAWNVVVFGAKRWLIWDHARFKSNVTRQRDFALEGEDEPILSSAEWIRRLYPHPERTREMREHGHDCVQHAGEMMFVPRQWMHMVVNIGDTVSVISEVGLERGEGRKPEDFEFDPNGWSGDDGDGGDWDWSGDDGDGDGNSRGGDWSGDGDGGSRDWGQSGNYADEDGEPSNWSGDYADGDWSGDYADEDGEPSDWSGDYADQDGPPPDWNYRSSDDS